MDQFCRALHPDLDLSPTCLSWFRQAADHCTELIMERRMPGTHFWSTVKNLIFPVYENELLNQKIPISVHPNRLSAYDCQSLFLDIVNDYIKRAPRYAAETATNVLLWQILYSLMGIMTLGSFLVSTIFAYKSFSRTLCERDPLVEVFTPERRRSACAIRTLRIAKCELRRLRVLHLLQPEDVFAPDGTRTLVMKFSSKLDFIDQIVSSTIVSTGRLYRRGGKGKVDYKKETVSKVMSFLNNYPRKLRLMFVFDEDPLQEQQQQLLLQRRQHSPPKYAARTKSTVPQSLSPKPIQSTPFGFKQSTTPRTKSTPPQPGTPRNKPPPPPPMTPPLFKSVVTTTRSFTMARSFSPPPKSTESTPSPRASPRTSPRMPTQIPRNNFGRRSSMFSLRK